MRIVLLLLVSIITTGCVSFGGKDSGDKECIPVTLIEYQYRIPDIPDSILTPTEKPYVDSWEGKTQVDVEEYIIDLHEAVDAGNIKLDELNNYLESLRLQEKNK